MPHPELERLTAEAADLIRRAVEIGIQMERVRVRALFEADADMGSFVAASPAGLGAIAQPRARRARGPSSSGHIGMVRTAFAEWGMAKEGVGSAELLAYLQARHPGSEITDKRVRGALKQLTNTGEVIRASRGRYLPRQAATPSPPIGEESPDAGASGDFDLAAE